ncbi:MAG: hypothetical protein HGA22_02840, partial [Clostridiales bacterium]|nr:hypothetical protein [Clostridiales bacterium]
NALIKVLNRCHSDGDNGIDEGAKAEKSICSIRDYGQGGLQPGCSGINSLLEMILDKLGRDKAGS